MSRLLLAVVGLLALGGLAIHLQPTEATYLVNGGHWAHAGTTPARIGVMVDSRIDAQLVANVLKEWDKAEMIEIGVVAGQPTAEMCAQNPTVFPPYGHVIVCLWSSGGGSASGLWTCPTYEQFPGCNNHFGSMRVFVPADYYPNMLCHEFGHVLGLDYDHDTVASDDPQCMFNFDTWAERNHSYCPGQVSIDAVDALMAHADVAPNYTVGPFILEGQDYGCPFPPYATPVATATSNPPTSTATSTATPSPTPTLIPTATPCTPPNSRKCRQ